MKYSMNLTWEQEKAAGERLFPDKKIGIFAEIPHEFDICFYNFIYMILTSSYNITNRQLINHIKNEN